MKYTTVLLSVRHKAVGPIEKDDRLWITRCHILFGPYGEKRDSDFHRKPPITKCKECYDIQSSEEKASERRYSRQNIKPDLVSALAKTPPPEAER